MKDKFSSIVIYFVLWVAVVVCQILLFQFFSADNQTIFAQPSLYYSTIILDIYIILLFYLNYFFFAPFMFRRKFYKEYIFLAVTASIIGFVIPIIFYSLFSWSMPNSNDGFPISFLGIVGPLFVISVGLAVRAVVEWAKLSTIDAEMRSTIAEQNAKIEELEAKIKDIDNIKNENTSDIVKE